MTGAGALLRVGYGGLVLGVAGPPATLAWLRDFLDGPFEHTAGAAAWGVRLRVDAAAYATAAAAPMEGVVEAFTLDGSFRTLPGRRDGDVTVLHDAERRVALSVGPGEVEVVAEEEGYAARLALLRAVRELATAHALRHGWLHLHASAVETRGRVVAFAGPRRSGKSTLLVHALLGGDARFVSNDRLFVDAAAAPPAARGMPTLVALREDSLDRFAGLAARLRTRGYDRRWSLEEAIAAPPADALPPSVSPAQLCALTGASPCGAGPLQAVLFPSVDEGPGYGLAPLAAAEAARRLRGSLLLAAVPERPPAAFVGDAPVPERDDAALGAACIALAEAVPCLALRLGPDAYAKGVWGAILQAC